jgi:hypothetical protein
MLILLEEIASAGLWECLREQWRRLRPPLPQEDLLSGACLWAERSAPFAGRAGGASVRRGGALTGRVNAYLGPAATFRLSDAPV